MAFDARKVIKGMLQKWGHDIFLLRRLPNSEEFETVYERHTVRHMYPGSRIAEIDQEQIEGITHEADMIYYFQWDVNPREGDMIYEPDPRYEDYPLKGATAWVISYTVPMRGAGGRVEYWMVGADREEPQ